MRNDYLGSFIVIWISFFISMCLEAIPWPGLFDVMRPSWIFLFLTYWAMALPHRISIGTAFFLGLFWDLLIGSELGVHALALSISTYLVGSHYQLLRNMAIWQQATIFAFLSLIVKATIFWAESLVNNIIFDPQYLWGGVLNALLWPWLYFLLRRVRRSFYIR